MDTPVDGCLGCGAYFAARRKAERFAHDFGQGAPALVRCRLTVQKPCYVDGDDAGWRQRGHDGCRASSTSRSANPEWCVVSSCIEVLEVGRGRVEAGRWPGDRPAGLRPAGELSRHLRLVRICMEFKA